MNPTPVALIYLAVMAIILAAGVFGGVVGVAIAAAPDNETPDARRARRRSALIAGVGASALVPLFLQTVSSTLLTDMFTRDAAEPWFVFAGFCLLAAISARQFIQTLSDRVLSELKDHVKAVDQKVDAAHAKAAAAQEQASGAAQQAETVSGRADRLEPHVRAATDALRYGTRPTDTPAEPAAPAASLATDARVPPGKVQDDPWKGAFGGQAHAAGRQLSATLRPVDGEDWQAITLRVRADAGAPPLAGSVQFFLHPTFATYDPVVAVENGEATITVVSWGAFTAGALADGGATRLELDLMDLPGAPEPWRSR